MSVILLQDPHALWLLTRGAGLVAFLLLTASVVLGVCGPVRLATPRWPRFAISSVHRTVAMLSLVVLALHIVTTIADGYTPIDWVDVVVPFASPYRTVWLGLGTVATDLMLVIVITSLLRVRLGPRAWQVMHWTTYICWPVALLHFLGTGTDATNPVFFGLAMASMAAVLMAIGWRLWRATSASPERRLVAASLALAMPVGIGVWALTGPLQPGWAARAGTPKPAAAAPTATGLGSPTIQSASSAAAAKVRIPFRAELTGTTERTPLRNDRARVELLGRLSGGLRGTVMLTVEGRRTNDGLQWDRGGALLGPTGRPDLYSGGIVRYDARVIVLRLSAPNRPDIDVRLAVDRVGPSVSGTVRGVRTPAAAPPPARVVVVQAPASGAVIQAAAPRLPADAATAPQTERSDHDEASDDDLADAREDCAEELAEARGEGAEELADAREDCADDLADARDGDD